MILRISSDASAPFNYAVPIVSGDGSDCEKLLEFSFNSQKLTGIAVRKLGEVYGVKNDTTGQSILKERVGDMLFQMHKNGLKISSELADSHVLKEQLLNKQQLINEQLAIKSTEAIKLSKQKVISGNNAIASATRNCVTVITYEFMFQYAYYGDYYQTIAINNSFSSTFQYELRQMLYGADFEYVANVYNQINFYNINNSDGRLSNSIKRALENAAYYMKLYNNNVDYGQIIYFRFTDAGNCGAPSGGGGGGTTEPTQPNSNENNSAPNIKIPIDVRLKYPTIAKIIDGLYDKVKNDPKLMEALKKYSNLTEQEILDNLKTENGPTIIVKDLSILGGHPDAHFNSSLSVIEIDISVATDANYVRIDGATAFEFFLTAVILHEFIHFGNNLSETFYPNFGKWDAGFQFENKYYGGVVQYEPYNTNSPTVIWFKKIPGL